MIAEGEIEIDLRQPTKLEQPQIFISPTWQYKQRLSNGTQTFYVDIGSAITKAGNLDLDKSPVLVCPSKTMRARRQNQDYSISGNAIFQESSKITAKSILELFKANDAKSLEDFMDYVFTEIEINQHDRLLFSEPLGMMPKFRESLFELGFECYGLSELMPVVESITAGYQVWKEHKKSDYVLVSIGAMQTSILPFLNCNLDTSGVRKIGLGMENMRNTFVKLFNIKYPGFTKVMSPRQINTVFERYGFISFDYKSQMKYYQMLEFGNQEKNTFLEDLNDHRLMPQISIKNMPSETERARMRNEKQTHEQKRQEIFRKLADKLREGKEIKRKAMETELENLENAEKMIEQTPKQNQKAIFQNFGFEKEDEFSAKLNFLRKKLGREKPCEDQKEKFALLEIPDDELTPHQLKSKRYLYLQKTNFEKRQIKRIEKEKKTKEIERLKTENREGYVTELKLKRHNLKSKIKRIKYFNEDPNFKKRKDHQLIENLDNMLEGKTDNNAEFDQYLNELMDISSDCERYDTEIQILNGQIKEIEPEFDDEFDNEDLFLSNRFDSTEQMNVGADLARSAECIFRPHLIGLPQKGIFESLKDLMNRYDFEARKRLLRNIFIVGGGGHISGFDKRLRNDLYLHFSGQGIDEINVSVTNDPMNTGYSGVRNFYLDFHDKISNWIYTKAEYDEYGPRLFKTCPIGNL